MTIIQPQVKWLFKEKKTTATITRTYRKLKKKYGSFSSLNSC